MWMFYNWLEDQNDDVELVKNHAYLLASFDHPEAVRKLTGEGAQHYTTTEDEFEASTKLVIKDAENYKDNLKNTKGRKKRKKRIRE